MNSDIKNEINRILASEDNRSWNQLFKFLHQQKEHPDLEDMVDYAGQLLSKWQDESRSHWPPMALAASAWTAGMLARCM